VFMFSPEAKAINLVAGAGADAMESNHRHRDFQSALSYQWIDVLPRILRYLRFAGNSES
jgi:hypothetical protein